MSTSTHLDQIVVFELPEKMAASRHAAASGHAIARSAEPGEDWSRCYVDEVAFVVGRR